MTRRQVRAAMRRMKEHAEEAEEENGELNLVPYLDIITNIIIFLLASVVMNVSFGNVNVTLPTLAAGGGVAAEEPQKPPLNLTVTAGATGFTVGGSGGIMSPLPKLPDGQYDYKALTAKLMEIKAAPENADETKVTFNADAYIPYEVVVQTLDAMREDTSGKLLFPDVVFAAGILVSLAAEGMSRLRGKKAIRSYARKMADPETIRELNITPMMDLMTIILVFLLKNFSSSTQLITQDANLQVPPSITKLQAREAVPVTITKRMIIVEGEAVAPVNNGKVDASLKPDGENGYLIQPIVGILTRIASKERRVAEMMGQKFDSELMVVADRTIPYRLLTEVLYSCGQAGYSNYRLVVLKTSE